VRVHALPGSTAQLGPRRAPTAPLAGTTVLSRRKCALRPVHVRVHAFRRFGNVTLTTTALCAGPCAAGRYGVAGAITSACTGACSAPPGYECLDGSSSPTGTACTPGTWSVGGSYPAVCAPCSAGSYGNVLATSSSTCSGPCPVGTYGQAGWESCVPCPVGRYGNVSEQTTANCSGACSAAPGFGCDLGAVSATGTLCPAGQFGVGGAASCTLCPPGRFGTVSGAANYSSGCGGVCTAVAGWVCSSGMTTATGVACPSGYTSSAGATNCTL
jgi:hypothetical protein